MNKSILTALLVCTTGILLGSCNLPGVSQPSQGSPAALYTQAAETIVAQLTYIVGPEGGTPASGENETPVFPDVTAVITPSPSRTLIPTLTETPTPSASPTITQTVTATVIADDPKLSLGSPTWRDDFSSETNWSLYEDEYVRFQIKDGKLLMQAISGENRDSWIMTWPDPVDYYLEAIFQPQTCSGLDRYGVIVRSDSSEGYLFGFACDGRYSLRIWDGESFTALIDWTTSPHILAGAGQTNRLGIKLEGNTLSLYANGILLVETSDNTYDEGGFGVFVGSQNNEDAIITVDEIAYWELP